MTCTGTRGAGWLMMGGGVRAMTKHPLWGMERVRCDHRNKHWVMLFKHADSTTHEADWMWSRCYSCGHSQMSHDQKEGRCVAGECQCENFFWGIAFDEKFHRRHTNDLCEGTP